MEMVSCRSKGLWHFFIWRLEVDRVVRFHFCIVTRQYIQKQRTAEFEFMQASVQGKTVFYFKSERSEERVFQILNLNSSKLDTWEFGEFTKPKKSNQWGWIFQKSDTRGTSNDMLSEIPKSNQWHAFSWQTKPKCRYEVIAWPLKTHINHSTDGMQTIQQNSMQTEMEHISLQQKIIEDRRLSN